MRAFKKKGSEIPNTYAHKSLEVLQNTKMIKVPTNFVITLLTVGTANSSTPKYSQEISRELDTTQNSHKNELAI